MARLHLPHEILCLIAKYVAGNDNTKPRIKLGSYALVSKAWQAAFEAEIYSTVWLQSPSDIDVVIVGHEEPRKKRGLTHQLLDKITTGPQPWRQARRAAIRHVLYWIAVSHWLCNGLKERKRPEHNEQHSYDNSFRRQNDEAFSRGVQALFEYLSSPSWLARSSCLSLSLVLQAENVYTSDMKTEPGTQLSDEYPLADYRATLTVNTTLTPVRHVRAVDFPRAHAPAAMGEQNGISLTAQLRILAACGDCNDLVEARLNGAYEANEEPLLVQKRNDTAETLGLLPNHIRTLHLQWRDEVSTAYWDLVTRVPMIHLRNQTEAPHDVLSRALHNTSIQLRELHIDELDITPDLFSLSNEECQSPVVWPHLEILRLTATPIATSNGQSLTYMYQPDRNGGLVPHTPWQEPRSTRQPYVENQDEDLSIVPGFFDELYTNVGQAVQKMPKLRNLLLLFDGERQELHIRATAAGGGGRVLRMYSHYGYSPTREVLNAWRVPDRGMVLRPGVVPHQRVLEYDFDSWPPPP